MIKEIGALFAGICLVGAGIVYFGVIEDEPLIAEAQALEKSGSDKNKKTETKWKKLAQGEDFDVYVNLSSMKMQKNGFSAQLSINDVGGTKAGKRVQMSSRIQDLAFNCEEGTARLLKEERYPNAFGRGNMMRRNTRAGQWEVPDKDTAYELMLETYCPVYRSRKAKIK